MPIQAPLQVTRHVQPLSEEETDEVVGVVADLIVNFLKAKRSPEPSAGRAQEVGA
jgi:hypothetical protein